MHAGFGGRPFEVGFEGFGQQLAAEARALCQHRVLQGVRAVRPLFRSYLCFCDAPVHALRAHGPTRCSRGRGPAACGPAPTWLIPLELLILDIGLLASIWLQYKLARQLTGRLTSEFAAWLPWAILTTALWITGVWIIFQPMEMRGTMPS